MGNKKTRTKFNSQLRKFPLTLCDINMKESKVIKYLGDYLSSSLEDSVHQTVMKRSAVVRLAIYEIRTIIEDAREQSILPMLTFNGESWIGMGKKTLKVLNDLFHTFCRVIFRVGIGCPTLSFYWQSCSKTFDNIILENKLIFTHHFANLSEGNFSNSNGEKYSGSLH